MAKKRPLLVIKIYQENIPTKEQNHDPTLITLSGTIKYLNQKYNLLKINKIDFGREIYSIINQETGEIEDLTCNGVNIIKLAITYINKKESQKFKKEMSKLDRSKYATRRLQNSREVTLG